MYYPSLDYFIEIAKHLNLSIAATKLNVSQQSLSAYVQKLESFFDLKLLERKPVLRLTKAGEAVYKTAEKIGTIQESLLHELARLKEDSSERKHVSIGIFRPNASQLMNFIPLAEFNKAYPQISYSIMEESNHSLRDMLSAGKVDLIVSSYNPSSSFPDFNESILYNDNEYILISDDLLREYFPEKYPECIDEFKKGVSLAEFHRIPILMYPTDSAYNSIILQYFKDRNLEYTLVGESPNRYLTTNIVHKNMALGFCNSRFLNFLKQDPFHSIPESVYSFPIVEPMLKRTVGVLYRKSESYPQYFTDLIRMTQKHCRLETSRE